MSQCLCLKQNPLQAEVRQNVTSLWVPEEVPEGGVSLRADASMPGSEKKLYCDG